MKALATLLLLSAFGSATAIAAEGAEPGLPDPAYCSQRDADPRKCVIQDGPPPRPIVRKKQEPPVVPPPAPEKPAGKSPGLIGR